MSWLLVTWFLAFGYVPMQYESVFNHKVELDSDRVTTVAQLGFNAEIAGNTNVFVELESFQYVNQDTWRQGSALSPYRIDCTFGVSFEFNKWVSIIATHECDHVIKLGRQEDGYESNETKVMLRIDGSSKF